MVRICDSDNKYFRRHFPKDYKVQSPPDGALEVSETGGPSYRSGKQVYVRRSNQLIYSLYMGCLKIH
jgi:hypothetical protein